MKFRVILRRPLSEVGESYAAEDVDDLVWFGLVLWHTNHCRLFNTKSSLYMYTKYMIYYNILLITFLNDPDIFLSQS